MLANSERLSAWLPPCTIPTRLSKKACNKSKVGHHVSPTTAHHGKSKTFETTDPRAHQSNAACTAQTEANQRGMRHGSLNVPGIVGLGAAAELCRQERDADRQRVKALRDRMETAFKDGWFFTGDLGRVDENGVLFLLDRKKDMVVTGGENVYTSEVEAALYSHEDVHEAAVIGVPDDKFGEALFAVIVPAPGKTLAPKEIIEHCRGRIGGYKIPRQMDFIQAMPKSAMGKILKTELRDRYGKG